MITAQQIIDISGGHVLPDILNKFFPFIPAALTDNAINTAQRMGGFFSQTLEESANLRYVKELASGSEYEGRADLGNVEPGDGVKFKGRGLIQITGRNNYKACSIALFKDLRLLTAPELLEQPEFAVSSACWFWNKAKNLNAICDLPETWIKPGQHNYSKFQWLTILINGGLNGYDVRLANYQRARTILNF